MAQHPEFLWAQRSSPDDDAKNVLYLTVNLPDIVEPSLLCELKPTSMTFEASTGDNAKGIEEKKYAFQINFYAEIVPESSVRKLSSRSFYLTLRKKEKKAEYWPRLTKENVKTPYIKTDFSKWVDEDEQGDHGDHGDDMDDMGSLGLDNFMPPDATAVTGNEEGSKSEDDGEGSKSEDDGEDSDNDGPPPLENVESPK